MIYLDFSISLRVYIIYIYIYILYLEDADFETHISKKEMEKNESATASTKAMFTQHGIKDSKSAKKHIASFSRNTIIYKIGFLSMSITLIIIIMGYILGYLCILKYHEIEHGGEYFSNGYDQYSYLLKADFYIRNLILGNEGRINYTLHGWESKEDLLRIAREDFDECITVSRKLNQNYLLHKGLTVGDISTELIHDSLIPLEYLRSDNSIFVQNFSLLESSCQLISTLITLKSLPFHQFKVTQKDVFFYIKNTNNAHIIGLIKIFNDYVNTFHGLAMDSRDLFRFYLIFIVIISLTVVILMIPCIYYSTQKSVKNFERLMCIPRTDLKLLKENSEFFINHLIVQYIYIYI